MFSTALASLYSRSKPGCAGTSLATGLPRRVIVTSFALLNQVQQAGEFVLGLKGAYLPRITIHQLAYKLAYSSTQQITTHIACAAGAR